MVIWGNETLLRNLFHILRFIEDAGRGILWTGFETQLCVQVLNVTNSNCTSVVLLFKVVLFNTTADVEVVLWCFWDITLYYCFLLLKLENTFNLTTKQHECFLVNLIFIRMFWKKMACFFFANTAKKSLFLTVVGDYTHKL